MVAGLLLCAAWYYTILSGFFILYCPVLYLMFFKHKLYRKVVDALFALWELYPVALFQCCCCTQLHHFGDYVDPNEKTIVVMNHRTRVDWNYIWIALYHATQDPDASDYCMCKEKAQVVKKSNEPSNIYKLGGKAKTKFVLKDEIKAVPGLGWIMQLNFFLYVKRNWQEDESNLTQFVDYYKKLRYDYRIVLFPEGTDLSDDNRRRSDRFADTHNLSVNNSLGPHNFYIPWCWAVGFDLSLSTLSRYEYVLHPRTTGWAVLCSRLRGAGLASVYDVTVAYDQPAQTEADLLRGNIPTHVYFHFKRYSIENIPSEEAPLRTWLNDRWRDKETNLRKFHNEGCFIDPETKNTPPHRVPRSMLLAKIGFIFWTTIDVFFTYSLLNSVMFQFWVIYHSLLFVIVTWYFGGFHHIQLKLLNRLIM